MLLLKSYAGLSQGGQCFKVDPVLGGWPACFHGGRGGEEARLRSGSKIPHWTCNTGMLFLNLRTLSVNHQEELPRVENGLLFLLLMWTGRLALLLASSFLLAQAFSLGQVWLPGWRCISSAGPALTQKGETEPKHFLTDFPPSLPEDVPTHRTGPC